MAAPIVTLTRDKEAEMADESQAPKDLIGFLDFYLVKKAPFQLPDGAKEAIPHLLSTAQHAYGSCLQARWAMNAASAPHRLHL